MMTVFPLALKIYVDFAILFKSKPFKLFLRGLFFYAIEFGFTVQNMLLRT